MFDGDARALGVVLVEQASHRGPRHLRPGRDLKNLRGALRERDDVSRCVPASIAALRGIEREAETFRIRMHGAPILREAIPRSEKEDSNDHRVLNGITVSESYAQALRRSAKCEERWW
jgi:hypothetical protein